MPRNFYLLNIPAVICRFSYLIYLNVKENRRLTIAKTHLFICWKNIYTYLRLKRTNCAPTYLGIYAHNFVPKSNECESALECEKRMPTRKCSLTWSYSLSFLLYLRFPVLFLFVSPFVLSGYSVV